jgi:hypothetical protein
LVSLLADTLVDALLGTIWKELLTAIIVAVVMTIFVKFWQNIVLIQKKFRFMLLNSPARIRAASIAKYRDSPTSWLSNAVFESIVTSVTSDKLTKQGVHERAIALKSDRLGIPLTLWLEEEFDTSTSGTDRPRIEAYKVTLDMEAELRLGYREVREFQDFVALAQKVQEVVQVACFPASRTYDSYIVCEAKRDAKLVVRSKGKIEDEILRVSVVTEEDRVELVSTEPMYLTEALKKYFPI